MNVQQWDVEQEYLKIDMEKIHQQEEETYHYNNELTRFSNRISARSTRKTGVKFELGRGSEVNMTAAYKKAVKKIFMNKLEEYAGIVARQLYDRYKFQCSAIAKQFPLLMSGLWVDSDKLKPNDEVEPVLKHGTLGVGFIGLAEALTVLTGKHHGESEESQNQDQK